MQVARIQAALVTFGLAGALGWLWLHRLQPLTAGLGVAALLLAHAAVLALEFALQRWVSRGDPVPAPGVRQWLAAWAHEVLAAPRLFGWRQPFRSRRFADAPHGGLPGRRGIVLVHGYLCNRGAWNHWLERLARERVACVAVNLAPPLAEIDAHVAAVDAAIARLTQATGQAPLVVGHSMGGLVLRAWLCQTRAPQRVHRLVTLATPHQGTWLARFGLGRCVQQMRPGSAWLQTLERDTPGPWRARVVNFYSNADNIVFPPSLARLGGADNRLVPGVAHVQLVDRPEVMDAVLALLDAPALAETARAPAMSAAGRAQPAAGSASCR